MRQVDENVGKTILSLYDVGTMSGLTEVLFMERCLKLLKKGGRMGMVLPEGVLNTSNLQKVRDYFEGKVKIILICSIPQDVFVAAGATVKPSLVFFKRFTDDEERQYEEIKTEAFYKAILPFRDEHDALLRESNILTNEGKGRTARAREARQRIAEIVRIAEEEAKPLVKEFFDYEIPIALVNDGGVTSTGSPTDNRELKQLLEEFAVYNAEKKLWDRTETEVSYKIGNNGNIIRVSDGQEVKLTWLA